MIIGMKSSRSAAHEADAVPTGGVPIGIVGMFLWIGLVFATLYLLSRGQEGLLDARRAAVGPSFWSETRSPLEFWLIIATIGAGIAAIMSPLSAPVRAALLVLALSAMACGQMMLWRSYYGIVRGEVVVHSALPWKSEARFRLADGEVIARGCERYSGRRTHNYAIFRIRYTADDIVDIGSGLGPYNNRAWLAAMRPFTEGTLRLPEAGGVERDPYCISAKSHGLDERARAEMRRLLG